MTDRPTLTPRNPQFAESVRDYVSQQGYLGLLGAELARIEPGRVVLRVPFRAELGQQNGFFHGGVVGSVAEAAMGSAAYSLVEAGTNVVGSSYRVDLLSPGIGEALVADCRVVKSGRTLIVCRVNVTVEDESSGDPRLIAIAQGTMVPVPQR